MISDAVIDKVARSVCAIERLDLTLKEMHALNPSKGQMMPNLGQRIIGTGFRVANGWVLTNQHVASEIMKDVAKRKEATLEHWFLEWSYPGESGGWSSTLKQAMLIVPLVAQGQAWLDVALVGYTYNAGDLDPTRVAEFADLSSLRVGRDVAICGYLGGNSLLRGIPGAPRFGPVVHSGVVSGVAPYDTANPRDLKAILTDFNTGGGFSGSPLFDPTSGRVMGVHHSGFNGGICGVGLPLDRVRVDGWINFVEIINSRGQKKTTFEMTGGGDIKVEHP